MTNPNSFTRPGENHPHPGAFPVGIIPELRKDSSVRLLGLKAYLPERGPTILDVAYAIGQTFPRFYEIGTCTYWDDKEKKIIQTLRIEGVPEVSNNRSARREIEDAVRKKKKKLLAEEREVFKDLYACASLIADSESNLQGQEKVEDLLENRPELSAPIKQARAFLEDSLNENWLLRFFVWTINEIAAEILDDKTLRDKYITKPEAFTRERKITLSELFTILLTMAGDNLNNEIYEYFKLKPEHPTPQAFESRRNQITSECVEYLYKKITEVCIAISSCMPAKKIHKFKSILACDGSDVNSAWNPNDNDTYIKDGKGGKGWNQYHLNGFLDACLGLFVNGILQPKKKTHETQAAADMIRSMVFKESALFIGDRGYGSLNLIETIRRTENLDCLIRIKDRWINEVAVLPMEELDLWMTIHVITTQTNEDKERVKRGEAKYLSGESRYGKDKISKVWDYGSEVDVTFRVVRLQLDSGGWETLVTTLDEQEFPVEKVKELYFLRWGGVENAFRVLKWDNHLAQMHCKKSDFTKQEVWARLAMFNIVACVVNCANEADKHLKGPKITGNPKKELKHEYIVNRRFATHVVCDYLKNIGRITFDVIEMILQYKTPIRAGRSFKRDMRSIGFAQFAYR